MPRVPRPVPSAAAAGISGQASTGSSSAQVSDVVEVISAQRSDRSVHISVQQIGGVQPLVLLLLVPQLDQTVGHLLNRPLLR